MIAALMFMESSWAVMVLIMIDGVIDNDADGDGYSDVSCGGLDCDDSDSTAYDVCIDGTSCIDILTQGGSTGDGMYEIDPDGVGGEDSYFGMRHDDEWWGLDVGNALTILRSLRSTLLIGPMKPRSMKQIRIPMEPPTQSMKPSPPFKQRRYKAV